jgi:hypothetical protein
VLDQSAYVNPNAEWVNHKGPSSIICAILKLTRQSSGAWLMHPILILVGKICLDIFPGMSQQASWTIVNLGYLAVNQILVNHVQKADTSGRLQITYLMFHWATGIPFGSEMHAGAYDDLTFWEQIDGGEQYTPAKKFLICTPIVLCVFSRELLSGWQVTPNPLFLQISPFHPLHTLQSVGVRR